MTNYNNTSYIHISSIASTRNIVYPFIDILVVKDVSDLTASIWNKKQSHQDLQEHPIFIIDADHDYTLE